MDAPLLSCGIEQLKHCGVKVVAGVIVIFTARSVAARGPALATPAPLLMPWPLSPNCGTTLTSAN